MFSPETVALIKQRIDEQVPPIVHHLADLAASQATRQRIGALIKREVDEYYDRLSFFKKIFISRERIYYEVDDLMNHHLPRRVEEYLRGDAFAQDATLFLNETVDSFMQRPLKDLVGQIPSDSFAFIKEQAAARFIDMLRTPELAGSINAYMVDALGRLQPQLAARIARVDQPRFSRAGKGVSDEEPAHGAGTGRHCAHYQFTSEFANRKISGGADRPARRSHAGRRN